MIDTVNNEKLLHAQDVHGIEVGILHDVLRLAPQSGRLFWRTRGIEMFPGTKSRTPHHSQRIWNSRYSGLQAFTSVNFGGYFQGKIFNKPYLAHRVVFAMAHGAWPIGHVDHINGNRFDNSVSNLRDVSRLENSRNRATPDNNTSGVLGVYWHSRDKKWIAQIVVGGKARHLGCYREIGDAIAARRAADFEYGFHENHGRTAHE